MRKSVCNFTCPYENRGTTTDKHYCCLCQDSLTAALVNSSIWFVTMNLRWLIITFKWSQNGAFHQVLSCLLRSKQSSETDVFLNLDINFDIIACDSLILKL